MCLLALGRKVVNVHKAINRASPGRGMTILGLIKRRWPPVGFIPISRLKMTVPVNNMQILPKLKFDVKPEEILNLTRSVLEFCVKELDRVGSLPATQCTFNNTIWPLAQLETKVGTELSAANFLQYVSTNPAIRDASVEATKLIDVRRFAL